MAKKLIVTGTSTGIGRAIALRALNASWDVLATVRKDADRAGLEEAGAQTALLDICDEGSIDAFTKEAAEFCDNKLDALVNNAGTAYPGPVEALDLDEIRVQFEVNCFGHIAVTQQLLPALREAHGRVIFVSSNSVNMPTPFLGAYVASKRALEGFAESLAFEVGSHDIDVTLLVPGAFDTGIWDTSIPRGESHEHPGSLYAAQAKRAKAIARSQPMGDPDDVADAALELLESRRPPMRRTVPFAAAAQGSLYKVLPFGAYKAVVQRVAGLMARRSGSGSA